MVQGKGRLTFLCQHRANCDSALPCLFRHLPLNFCMVFSDMGFRYMGKIEQLMRIEWCDWNKLSVVHKFPEPNSIGLSSITISFLLPKLQVKEKANHLVLFDQDTYEKLYKEAPKYKLITPSVLSERLHISGSLARMAIKELMAKDEIRMVSQHSSQLIYTRATNI